LKAQNENLPCDPLKVPANVRLRPKADIRRFTAGKIVEGWSNQTDSGQNGLGPSEDRRSKRSETYLGIADAIGEQWQRTLDGVE
jgi:hypothetical protein